MWGNPRYDNKKQDTQSADGIRCIWGIFMLWHLLAADKARRNKWKRNLKVSLQTRIYCSAKDKQRPTKDFVRTLVGPGNGRCGTGTQHRWNKTATPSFALWGQTAVYGKTNTKMQRQRSIPPEYEQIEHQKWRTAALSMTWIYVRRARYASLANACTKASSSRARTLAEKYIRVNGIYYRVIGMCSSEG